MSWNTICDTCALNSRRYEYFGVKADKVVKSRKMVKKAENTSSDNSALNSWRFGSFEVSTLTVVISRKPVN